MSIRIARMCDEEDLNALAKLSPFTRDFANPPMSLKAMRAEAISAGQVLVYEEAGQIVGFVWCRPMKPKHMPFSTVYYMGVHPEYARQGIAAELMYAALDWAKNGRIELVCEDGNKAAAHFYRKFGMRPLSKGTVGKDNRPYTRWYVEAK